MNTTDLIERVRRSAWLENSAVDWTDSIILEELNDVLTQLYERAVVTADQGHWQLMEYYVLPAGTRTFRLPERACAGAVGRFQLSQVGSVDWYPLDELPESDALRYEYADATEPQRVCVRGESAWILPMSSVGTGYAIRVQYMIRPSRLTAAQGTTAGLITNISGRVLTLSAATNSVSPTGTSTPQTTGTVAIDIVHPEGWHAVQWTGTATLSASGLTCTLATHSSGLAEANDLSMIRVGDYVRIASQTDWPPLPYDFHRSLADATAAKILVARGLEEKAAALTQSFVTGDLKRFGDMLQPRVGASAFVFVAPEFV